MNLSQIFLLANPSAAEITHLVSVKSQSFNSIVTCVTSSLVSYCIHSLVYINNGLNVISKAYRSLHFYIQVCKLSLWHENNITELFINVFFL